MKNIERLVTMMYKINFDKWSLKEITVDYLSEGRVPKKQMWIRLKLFNRYIPIVRTAKRYELHHYEEMLRG